MAQNKASASGRYRVLFERVKISRIELRNRLAVAPMTRVSASHDGVPTSRMAAYYQDFAKGGFGLIITEGIYPEMQFGQAYERQPGLATEAQLLGWRRVTDSVHESGGVIFAQLMHSGALSQCLDSTIAPSSVVPRGEKMPEYGGSGPFPRPRSMTHKEIQRVIESFAAAASDALCAGFDGIEIHGANGYLIDQFLTDYTNQRSDEYGGDIGKRVRFACDVITAVREKVGGDIPVGIRLSQTKVNDFEYRWPGGTRDAENIFAAICAAGVSYIHIAGEGRGWGDEIRKEDGSSLTGVARSVTRLPVIANGGLHDPGLAGRVVSEGHADLIAIGRGALANPDWPSRVQIGEPLLSFDSQMLEPRASIENTHQFKSRVISRTV